MKRRYILVKYVDANNVSEAVKREPKKLDEVYIDSKWHEKVGFDNEESLKHIGFEKK